MVGIFVQALILPRPYLDLFGRSREIPPPERIGFLALPAGTDEGDGRPVGGGDDEVRTNAVPAQPEKPIVAPTAIPTTAPAATPDSTRSTVAGPSSGPLIGGKGNLKGVQPKYSDPRLWPQAGAVATAPTMPKTPAERLDSVITQTLGSYRDSVAIANGNQREPGDWTVERGGQKYGVDGKFIRLGPVQIPTAILALLPLNVTGNPIARERDRRNASMRAEIGEQTQRRINDADFQKAVRAIRERKERERKEAEEAKQKEQRDN